MRCSNCGLPLSPSRTNCPRCGTIYNGSPRKVRSEQDALLPQGGIFAPGNMPSEPNEQQGYVGAEVPYAQWNAYPAPTFHEATAGYPVEAGQGSSPTPDNEQAFSDASSAMPQPMPYQTPEPLQQGWTSATPPPTMSQPSGWTPAPASIRPFPQTMHRPGTSQSSRRIMRIGFTAASICLIAGALMLTLVSIMAQPLLSSNTSSPQITHINVTNRLSATIGPSPTLATPTAIGSFPGAQYITTARLASVVNENTGQALQYATNFAVNQKIYVTFALNTGAQGGAVCFRWYQNNQYLKAFDYAFGVEKNLLYNPFSYARMSNPGTGYIEVYWASTVSCTDKLLAQHVTFSVS
jgi:hypothetical protein